MEDLVQLVLFTVLPLGAFAVSTVYSLREIYDLGDRRPVIILSVLVLMSIHQFGELSHFLAVGAFRDPIIGELPETAANLVAAGSVYFLLSFACRERQLREELQQSQDEITRINHRLELIFNEVNDGILLIDLSDETILEANATANELLRYDDGELEGLSPYDIHPHQPEQYRQFTESVRTDGGAVSDNLSCRRSDGSTMPAAVSASKVELDGRPMLLATIRDNTEEERYRTQVALLARVLRHNLRNDMTVILGTLNLLADRLADSDLQPQATAAIEKCEQLTSLSDKTRKITNALNDTRTDGNGTTDLVTVVRTVVERYRDEYPTATLSCDLPADAPVAASDSIEWAIENIVENALVHATDEPTVMISIEPEHTHTEGQTAEWTTVRIADTGPGIPEHEISVLRDESKRSPTEHGSGLGLWVAQQITQAYDGHLVIETEPDGQYNTVVSLRLQPADDG